MLPNPNKNRTVVLALVFLASGLYVVVTVAIWQYAFSPLPHGL